MTTLAKLVVQLEAQTAQYVSELDKANKQLAKFHKDTTSALSGIQKSFDELGTNLVGKLAAVFAVDALIDFAKHTIETTAELDRLSERTGVSVEVLSGLKVAATQTGVGTEELALGLKRLNVAIADAAGGQTTKGTEALHALGINVRDVNGHVKDAGTIFAEVADKFATYADGANKTAIAVALLGKSGDTLIPTLNKGSAALKEFAEQAAEAGLIISSHTADAAEKFEQKVSLLKLTLIDGLGIRIEQALLPTLNNLADDFLDSAKKSDKLKESTEDLADTFRVLATAVVIAGGEIGAFVIAIAKLAKAYVELEMFDFTKGFQDANRAGAGYIDRQKGIADTVAAIWRDGQNDQLHYIDITEAQKKRILSQAPNITSSDAALKKLEAFTNSLQQQAATFGLGKAAAVEYDLTMGNLAKDVALTGAEGQKLAAAAIAAANALQFKIDTREIDKARDLYQAQVDTFELGDVAAENYKLSTGNLGEAFARMGGKGLQARDDILKLEEQLVQRKDSLLLTGIDIQLKTLREDLVGAATEAFDLQNKLLKTNLTADHDQAGLDKLNNLRDLTIATADYNKASIDGQRIRDDLSNQEAEIQNKVLTNTLTQTEADQQVAALRLTASQQLETIFNKLTDIAKATNDPKLIDGAKKFGTELHTLEAQVDVFGQKVEKAFEDSFGKEFAKVLDGTATAGQAFKAFISDVEAELADLAAKDFASKIFGSDTGLGKLFGLGGLLGSTSTAAPGQFETSVDSIPLGSEYTGLGAATGGLISGPGNGSSDSIPAWLSDGEFVVNANATSRPGVKKLLTLLNTGHIDKLSQGGYVSNARGYEVGGMVEMATGTVAGKQWNEASGGHTWNVRNYFPITTNDGSKLSRRTEMQVVAAVARGMDTARRRSL